MTRFICHNNNNPYTVERRFHTMNLEVTIAFGSIIVHVPRLWTTKSSLRDVVNSVSGAVVQRVTVAEIVIDESDFESTKLGSLISDDQSSSIVIQISSDKKLKTEDNTNDMSVNHPDDDLSQVGLCAP